LNDSFIGNICFGVDEDSIDKKLYNYAINFSKLEELEKELNKNNILLNDTIKNLSGGQIQRIGIARALYRDNEILIFDEATNSLDEKTADEILNNIINIKDKTIIIVSHNLENLENCDHLYEFKNENLQLIRK
jgi:ABC-type bacteriocin/lantibiotic exporter with double-glycine peptidase domain